MRTVRASTSGASSMRNQILSGVFSTNWAQVRTVGSGSRMRFPVPHAHASAGEGHDSEDDEDEPDARERVHSVHRVPERGRQAGHGSGVQVEGVDAHGVECKTVVAYT